MATGTPPPAGNEPNPLDPAKGALAAFISNLVSNVGAVGVLMWIVIYQMPAQQNAFLTELRIEREVRQSQVENLTKAISDLAKEVQTIQKKALP